MMSAARAMFEKAAAQNHPGALERMGAFAQEGRGGPKDAAAAKSYYERAAALGNEDAKAELKRLECPVVLKDKRGNVASNLCFYTVDAPPAVARFNRSKVGRPGVIAEQIDGDFGPWSTAQSCRFEPYPRIVAAARHMA